MRLYWSPPMASLAILILAREAGMPIELTKVDPLTRRTQDGRLLVDINPKNCMPVLERDDGSILTETAVILDWMSAQDAQLRFTAPAGTDAHLRIQEWMVYFATEQHKLATLLFWDIGGEAKQAVKTRLIDRFALPEERLGTADFLVADRFTIADIYLLVMVRGCLHLVEGFDLAGRYPKVEAFMTRVSARPAVQRALQEHV